MKYVKRIFHLHAFYVSYLPLQKVKIYILQTLLWQISLYFHRSFSPDFKITLFQILIYIYTYIPFVCHAMSLVLWIYFYPSEHTYRTYQSLDWVHCYLNRPSIFKIDNELNLSKSKRCTSRREVHKCFTLKFSVWYKDNS